MLAYIALVALQQAQVATLQTMCEHYRHLRSFSCVIEQHNVTKDFPGDYTSRLEWAKGGKFELKGNKRPDPNTGPADYYSDGSNVLEVRADARLASSPLVVKDDHTVSKWELTAGVVLSWLLDTEAGQWWLQKQDSTNFQLSQGSSTDWKGYAVKEVVASANSGAWTTHFYFSADSRRLVGLQYGPHGIEGTILYRDQREDPIVLPSLGNFSG